MFGSRGSPGNPLMDYGQIGPSAQNNTLGNWNLTLPFYNGAFDEMFGSFQTQRADGSWDSGLSLLISSLSRLSLFALVALSLISISPLTRWCLATSATGIYIYIYIYISVCVFSLSFLPSLSF